MSRLPFDSQFGRRLAPPEPANPDVYGFLGYLYKQWVPRRITDAREAFRRAAELRTRKRDVYFNWIRLELDAKDAAVACDAAELGFERFGWARRLHASIGLKIFMCAPFLPASLSLLSWAGQIVTIL